MTITYFEWHLIVNINLDDDLFHVTLQTDDKGVFSTNLSQEYQLAATTFGLSHEAIWKLSQQAIDWIFAPDAVKQQLKQKWEAMKPQVFKWPFHWNLQPITYLKFQLEFFPPSRF